MNEDTLAQRLGELHAEYKASGQGIDEFLKAKLAASRENGEAAAETLVRTFAAIDANYADLQSAKAAGENRQEWLRRKLDEAIREAGADAEREKVGTLLAGVVDELNGAATGTTPPVAFDGIDAADTVAALDEALARNALSALTATDNNGSEDAQ